MNVSNFLNTIYNGIEDGWLEITYIAPPELKLRPNIFTQWKPLPVGEIDPNIPTIRNFNNRGYNVYFGVAVRREKKLSEEYIDEYGRKRIRHHRGNETDSSYLTALYIDIDDVFSDQDERYQKLLNLTPGVNIVVKSGTGIHGYILLNEPLKITDDNRSNVKRTLRGLAIAVGSDTKVAELARIMRLPTTINTKLDAHGTVCEVIDELTSIERYDYLPIEQEYAKLAGPKELPLERNVPAEASIGLPWWVDRYLENGAAVGKRNSVLFGAALEYKANGKSQNTALTDLGKRAQQDGLSADEITQTIDRAYRSTKKAKTNISEASDKKMRIRDRQIKNRKF